VRGFLALAPVLVLGLSIAGCGSSSSSGGGASQAALVNGNGVSMRAYQIAFQNARLETIDAQGYDPCQTGSTLCSLVKQQALDTVIQNELIREYAAGHNITVSPADVNRQWQLVYNQKFQARQDVLNAWLKHIYSYGGLHQTVQDLKNGVAQDMLQQRVMVRVIPSVPAIAPGMRLAVIEAALPSLKYVQQQLATGRNFMGLANVLKTQKKSQCKQLRCGELGWVPNQLIPANRQQLLTAHVGSLVGPYKTSLIFDIYQVQARVDKLILTPRQQYQIRATRFADWLAAQQSHAKVTRYVAV
jgi:hypothetical protein